MSWNLGMCEEKNVRVDLCVDNMDDPKLPVKNGLVGPRSIRKGYAKLKRPVGDTCPVCGSKNIDLVGGQDYDVEWDDPAHYYYTLGCRDCYAEFTETWKVSIPWAGEDPEYWGGDDEDEEW